jgi:hypothetical protein
MVPQFDVGCALGKLWQVKRIFAVEAAGTIKDGGIEALGMVRRGQNDDAHIGRKSIQFIGKVGAVLWVEQGV